MKSVLSIIFFLFMLCVSTKTHAQTLEERLLDEDPARLAQDAVQLGDEKRGAVAFYQVYMACTKCHNVGDSESSLGPDLTKLEKKTKDVAIVESILQPSKVIKKGFEPISVITGEGKTITGLVVENNAKHVIVRDAAESGRVTTILADDIEVKKVLDQSIMPAGQVNQLVGRQQFLDLVKYVIELRDGGLERARELEPAPSLYAARPLPEYEQHIDHQGMIASLNNDSYKRGEAIYLRLCANCHGTHDREGSLPTSRKFATEKFKSGSDPYTMYQTLTRGFGMMVPQSWMVPQQKYDVVHYIREAYLKNDNPTQHFDVSDSYLDGLPKGDTRGPAPSQIVPWEQMNYGPNLIATYEIGNDASNFAYKGIATRVDQGQGGVSKGNAWMVFDHDTMRLAGAWTGEGFIDWNGINFNGRHNIHPRVTGDVHLQNKNGPGWANPDSGSFEDPRFEGRDGRLYGPLPRDWAQYKGLYHFGNQTIINYTVGDTTILEAHSQQQREDNTIFARTLSIGPRNQDLTMSVLQHPSNDAEIAVIGDSDDTVVFGHLNAAQSEKAATVRFDGGTYLQIPNGNVLDTTKDYTLMARFRTNSDGTIVCKSQNQREWVPDGKSLFIRNGLLSFDVGWVGVVKGKTKVTDGKFHDVAMTFESESNRVSIYLDGKLDAQGTLAPKKIDRGFVLRVGYTSETFPESPWFKGDIEFVRIYQKQLTQDQLTKDSTDKEKLVGSWSVADAAEGFVKEQTGKELSAQVVQGAVNAPDGNGFVAGFESDADDIRFEKHEDGRLVLEIPKGKAPINMTVWMSRVDSVEANAIFKDFDCEPVNGGDLIAATKGSAARWPAEIKTTPAVGNDDRAFAVDNITPPVQNPWFAQMRLTGFDFYEDTNKMAVCSWDGDVWLVTGIDDLSAGELSWRRIASGLFQPLGLKIVNETIYIGCRDQICILHDLNGDGETDYYESFNSDHQVTDHFHEFAMGLQIDDKGNFYYAKSARHALTALVPHHGTLLRVTPDGERTDILATGFRAANGVCLNPDGTFIVTDQEGHWNPKNRINWVKEGGFYGNMYGYHDVTDESDEAMEQPLCWITNAFDRSPAELLWVDSKQWGPLNNKLLNLSYGYGKVFVVPHEEVNGQMQGGMCEIPIPQFPTGTIRGRFHPTNGQLYTCGMFAWAGSRTSPGGFYRLRYTGKPVYLPVELSATKYGMKVTFSGELDPDTATDLSNYRVKTWGLRRTKNYGSPHVDEKASKVTDARLLKDGKTVLIEIEGLKPTWGMEIKYDLKGADGETFSGTLHNTVHELKAE
tara:strand:- start:11877 stop:15749 length:3873 start_codon:yes stop_codon:yes gene_type:complete